MSSHPVSDPTADSGQNGNGETGDLLEDPVLDGPDPVLDPSPSPAPQPNPNPEPVEDARLAPWIDRVTQIENELYAGFVDYEAIGHSTMGTYFLSSYSDLTGVIREISTGIAGDKTGKVRPLFTHTVGLIRRFAEFATPNIDELRKLKDFHYKLKKRNRDIFMAPYITFDPNVTHYAGLLEDLASSITPTINEIWTNGELPYHKSFQQTFERFLTLDKRRLGSEHDYRHLCFLSQQCIENAWIALRVPSDTYWRLRVDLFKDHLRPTYVEYSCKTDEFLYGKGKRPGMLNIKLLLGGQITPEQQKRLDQAKGDTKKRPASSKDQEQSNTKKRRIERPYSMTIEDVEADILDIYSDAWFRMLRQKPTKLVTPTVQNRENTLLAYREDFTRRLRYYRRTFFQPEEPPTDYHKRAGHIMRLKEEMAELRKDFDRRAIATTSASIIKEARLDAFSLKFLQSLHLKLLLGQDPPASNQEINQALKDRLSDWILFERAWSAGDIKSTALERTSAATKELLRSLVRRRRQNINHLSELVEQFRELEILGFEAGGKEGRVDKPEETIQDSEANPTTETRKEGEQSQKQQDQIKQQQQQQEPPVPSARENPQAYFAAVVEGRASYPLELRKIGAVPSIEKRRFGRSVYVDYQLEEREKERAVMKVKVDAIGDPMKPFQEEQERRYAREDAVAANVTTEIAKGGPPDHDSLPTETVWDKLAYMIVLTHWRFYRVGPIIHGPGFSVTLDPEIEELERLGVGELF
ncbi:hypothetical protein M426DRAFT_23130 [Hypoxylon sp. CI-4A]|nr:hypothetical protein M426DRAFT_23130 [Hypoxylon sp. CI-4A]